VHCRRQIPPTHQALHLPRAYRYCRQGRQSVSQLLVVVAGTQSDTALSKLPSIGPSKEPSRQPSALPSQQPAMEFQGTLHLLGPSAVPSEVPDRATSQWPSTIPSWILHRSPLLHRPNNRPVDRARNNRQLVSVRAHDRFGVRDLLFRSGQFYRPLVRVGEPSFV
jgi:hypothetical protein